MNAVYRLLRNRKVVQTFLVYFSFFVFGFGTNLIPPSLLDITEITYTDVNEISTYSFVALSVSYCASSLIGGYFGKNVNRHLYLFMAMMVNGIGRFAIPFTRSLTHYTIVSILVGGSNAAIDIGANSWLLEIWRGGNSNMLMQGMHFTWSIGSAISPIVAEPFLSKKYNETIATFNSTTGEYENVTREIITETGIVYPFSICGILHVISCTLLLIMFFVHSNEPEIESGVNSEEEHLSDEQLARSPVPEQDVSTTSSQTMKYAILTTAGVVVGLETGMQLNTFNYLTVFAVGHKYSKSTGAYLLSALTLCHTISRGLATVATFKVPIEYILFMSLTALSIATVMLTTLVDYGEHFLWIGFCLIGFGFGPFYAGLFSYLSHHMTISTGVCGFFIFLSSLFVIVSDLTVGRLIETHLIAYNIFNVVSCILTVILFFVLRFIIKRNEKLIGKRTTIRKVAED